MRSHAAIFLCLALPFIGCARHPQGRVFPIGQMQEGDLAFRCGRGVFSRAVTSVENEGEYSHIGMLIQENGRWMVVHAVPGEKNFPADYDRVKKEPLEQFYAPKRAFRGRLVHTGVSSPSAIGALRTRALQYVADSTRFDEHYTLEDSSTVYCTELIWRLYRSIGIDLSEGRRRYIHIFRINGEVILPEHLLAYSKNTPYFTF